MPKQRLDQHLVALGLTESREQARRLIMAGAVRVDGQLVDKPAAQVAPEAAIEIKQRPRFVSRGGDKLDAALERFGVAAAGRVCADLGASTGGFTDVLLQRGAARVYAIDVGHGILDYRLRIDPRVVVLERTNARYLEHLPELVSLVTIDASFISLKLLLPVARGWLTSPASQPVDPDDSPPSQGTPVVFSVSLPPSFEGSRSKAGEPDFLPPSFEGSRSKAGEPDFLPPSFEGSRSKAGEPDFLPPSFEGSRSKAREPDFLPPSFEGRGAGGVRSDPGGEGEIIALIKPQFEAGRKQVGKGGIVKDPAVHRQVLADLLAWAAANQLGPAGLMRSPIKGAEGNVEFLIWLRPGLTAPFDSHAAIEAVLAES